MIENKMVQMVTVAGIRYRPEDAPQEVDPPAKKAPVENKKATTAKGKPGRKPKKNVDPR